MRRRLLWLSLIAVAAAALAAALLLGRDPGTDAPDAGATALAPIDSSVTTPSRGKGSATDDDGGAPVVGSPCDSDAECGEDLSCCAGRCVDVDRDRLNCGYCDRPCGGTGPCAEGECAEGCDNAPCPAGFTCQSEFYCVRVRCDDGAVERASCALDATQSGMCCGQTCVDVLVSADHCGDCPTVCPAGQFCNAGSCAPNVDCTDAGGETCPLGPERNGICCNDRCVDEDRDLHNCGACARDCQRGEVCSLGECGLASCDGEPSGAPCAGPDGGPNGSCCDGRCLPTTHYLNDSQNCGDCKARCPSGAACTQGNCTDPDSGRPFGCQRSGCGQDEVCLPDGICMRKGCNGVDDNVPCAESADQSGVCCGQVCVDVDQSLTDCGRCHQACDGGEICSSGVCGPFAGCGGSGQDACPLSATRNGFCCGGACVDTDRDPQNCGGCGQGCLAGRSCERGICRTADCAQSQNGEYCTAPNGAEAECCHGRCTPEVSFETDSASCGDCGVACPRGVACVDGACVDPDGGGTWSCAQSGCSAGQTCVGGDHCLPTSCSGIEDGLKCAGGSSDTAGICCGQQCIDPRFDPQHCGTCGGGCADGELCAFGACKGFGGCDAGGTPCPIDSQHIGLCCAAGCIDVEKDPLNCGACGVVCASGSCSAFECKPGVDGSP